MAWRDGYGFLSRSTTRRSVKAKRRGRRFFTSFLLSCTQRSREPPSRGSSRLTTWSGSHRKIKRSPYLLPSIWMVSLPFLVSDVRHIALGVGKRYGSFPFLRNQLWFCARMMPLASSKAIPRRKPPTGDFSQGDRGAVHVCRPRKLPESEIEGNTITYRNAF